jgi:hypothetical protein
MQTTETHHQVETDRGGLKLTACTFFDSIIRMEVLSLSFDVEPLPNNGLGPGQLFPHQ